MFYFTLKKAFNTQRGKKTSKCFKRKLNGEFPSDKRLPLHNTIAFPQLWRTDTAAPLGACGIDKQLLAEMGLIFDFTAVARHKNCLQSRKKVHHVSKYGTPSPAAFTT